MASCTAAVDVETALAVDLPGFEHVAPPEPPEQQCSDPTGGGSVRGVPPELGDPVSVAFRSGDDVIAVHAWATQPDLGSSVADRLGDAAAEDCAYEMFFDSDTDGDGQIDAGGSDVQEVEDWSADGWSGVRIQGDSSGIRAQVLESRLVARDDVLLWVTATGSDTGAAVDDLLEQVAGRLD